MDNIIVLIPPVNEQHAIVTKAEVPDLPGVMVYGITREEAVSKVEALALRVVM